MSLKKVLAFIFLILGVILITFVIFFFLNREEAPEPLPIDNSFPIGESNGSGITRDQINQRNDTNITLTNQGVNVSNQDVEAKSALRLRKLYNEPVAGGLVETVTIFTEEEIPDPEDPNAPPEIILNEETSYETIFVDRKNGHLILDQEHKSSQEPLSTTTILQTYRSFFSQNNVILQYLNQTQETIQTFAGTFREKNDIAITQEEPSETEDSETSNEETPESNPEPARLVLQERTLDGSVLSENIESISVSPDRTEFLYSIYGGRTEIRRSSFENPTEFQVVHQTPFRDVFVDWIQDDAFLLHAKADSRTEGFVEKISLTTGSITPITSGRSGLLYTEDPSGTYSLSKDRSSESLVLRNTKTGTSHVTSFASLPEKCIWSNQEAGVAFCAGQDTSPLLPTPESWYQGNFAYTDSLFRVDLNTNSSIRIMDPVDEGVPSMDIIPQSLSEDDARILFINKNTLEPWIYKIIE